MSKSDLERVSVSCLGMFYDSEKQDYFVKRIRTVHRFHTVLREWQKVEETDLEPILARTFYGVTNKLEFTIVTVRTALDPSTLRNVKAPFKVKVTVESLKPYTYLSMSNGKLMFHNFVDGTTVSASLNEMQKSSVGLQPLYHVKFDKGKRISNEQAKEFLKLPTTLKPIMEDVNGELRPVVFFQKLG
jgi:hypothetical protein